MLQVKALLVSGRIIPVFVIDVVLNHLPDIPSIHSFPVDVVRDFGI